MNTAKPDNNIAIFAAYSLLYILIVYLINKMVYTDEFYYSLLGQKIATERIFDVIKIARKYQVLYYLLIPILFLLRTMIFSTAIFCGFYLIDKGLRFGIILKSVIQAEIVFVVVMLIRLVYFVLNPGLSAQAIPNFYPLSLTNLINLNNIPAYYIYPLQLVNIFEVGYMFLIAYGIKTVTRNTMLETLKPVACSYLTVILLWLSILTFLQLQLS